MRTRLENDDFDDGAIGGKAHVSIPVLRRFSCNRFIGEMDHERVLEQEGRDTQRVVTAVGVLFVDPQPRGIFVARFAGVDQVGKPRVVDATLLHALSRVTGYDNGPLKTSAAHPRKLGGVCRAVKKKSGDRAAF